MTAFYTVKCCYLVSEHKALATPRAAVCVRQFPTGSGSVYASSVSPAWLADIWPSSVNQLPTLMVIVTCGLLAVAS